MTNHFTNASTYDGSFTFTAKIGNNQTEGKLSTTIGATYIKDASGKISPTDLYSNTSVSVREGLVSATAGVNVSAARGTRFHVKAVITADKYLDKYKQDVMGHWPDIELKIWDGQYKPEEKTKP